jgi:hypothetical protein
MRWAPLPPSFALDSVYLVKHHFLQPNAGSHRVANAVAMKDGAASPALEEADVRLGGKVPWTFRKRSACVGAVQQREMRAMG